MTKQQYHGQAQMSINVKLKNKYILRMERNKKMNKRLICEEAMRNFLMYLRMTVGTQPTIFNNANPQQKDAPTKQGGTYGQAFQAEIDKMIELEIVCMEKNRLETIIRTISNPSNETTENIYVTADEYECLMMYFGTVNENATKALEMLRREEEKLNKK